MTVCQTDWTPKLHAFLHDPFEKSLILFSERHTVRAGELLGILGLSGPSPSLQERLETADRYASATNRLVVEKEQQRHAVDFVRYPVLIHPLSGEELNLSDQTGPLQAWDVEGVNRFVQSAKENVEDVLRTIAAEYGQDHKRMFLALWRLVPERLRRTGEREERLGNLWTFLPADSRVPDHSIWDHLSTTSALITALEKPAFLLFTLGPVQEFIATARRTQDLWIGSFLLSYLAWQGIRAVAEHVGPDCIMFPNLLAQPLADAWLRQDHHIAVRKPESGRLSQASFPNRFLALVPSEEATALAEEARVAVIAEWRRIAESVKAELEHRLFRISLADDAYWSHLWHSHVETCFETYWIAYPWGEDWRTALADYKRWLGINGTCSFEDVVQHFENMRPNYVNPGTLYAPLYDLTERAMGSRKALRNTRTAVEEGYKCVLCGIREALHPSAEHTYHEIGQFWATVAAQFRGHFRPNGRERLCAVCTVKRLAAEVYFRPRLQIEASFPSTSTIAVESFRAEILQKTTGCQSELVALAEAFRGIATHIDPVRARAVPKVQALAQQADLSSLVRMDGRWFFPASYEIDTVAREYGDAVRARDESTQALTAAKHALQTLYKRLEEHGIDRPSPYYAIVYMDGDKMGEWLSGEHERTPTIRQILHPRVREALQSDWESILRVKRPLAPSLHTAISSALRAFSQHIVRPVVEQHCGILIYAGGDDVIAFFPLRHVLAAVWDLRRLYAGDQCHIEDVDFQAQRGFVRSGRDLWTMMGTTATASAGIAIAHHLQPLSQTLDAARDAERTAKQLLGRNAFAVHLLKRSGEQLITGARFTYDGGIASMEALQQVIDALRPNEMATLSSRFMYQLAREQVLGVSSALEPAQDAELHRLIGQHIEGQNREEREALAAALKNTLTPWLQALRHEHGEVGEHEEAQVCSPFNLFTNLLLLARFIAMEGRE